MKSLYSAKEAGEKLGIGNSQILKLIARGDIDGMLVGKQYVISAEEIAKYQQNRRPVGRPPRSAVEASV